MKAYSETLKRKARNLRQIGLSYYEISKKLVVAKSTIKTWCDDIILKPEHRERLYTKQIDILSHGPQSQKERRKREIAILVSRAEKEVPKSIDRTTYQLIGAALYWGEGSKTHDFCVTNSDPYLIKFIVGWMRDILQVNPKNIKAHLNIYPQQDEEKIKVFWSRLTGIPLKNFGKSFIKPISKGFKKNILYNGTIKLRVYRGTDLRYRVYGWIKSFLDALEIDTKNLADRWHKRR